MRYTKLDTIIKSLCSEVNDIYLHRYGEFYKLAHGWLIKVMDQRIGGPHRIARVPVDGRRVWIPQGMEVGKVGVNVAGSISVLLPNNNMLDLDDDCGQHSPPDTGNPDAPLINIGRTDYRIDGGYGFSWMGGGQYFDYMSGYWPGQGAGKSARGYYRFFPEKGYILLDSTSRYSEVILEGQMPTFVPYTQTWIAQCATEAIEAWCLYRSGFLASQVQTLKRPMVSYNHSDYLRAVRNLRGALNEEPLHVTIAAAQSHLGQIIN
jgi:hypothetical protein